MLDKELSSYILFYVAESPIVYLHTNYCTFHIKAIIINRLQCLNKFLQFFSITPRWSSKTNQVHNKTLHVIHVQCTLMYSPGRGVCCLFCANYKPLTLLVPSTSKLSFSKLKTSVHAAESVFYWRPRPLISSIPSSLWLEDGRG